jgi:hypothetical protein
MLYFSIISIPEELNQQQVIKYVVNNIRCLNSKPIHVTGSGLQPPHRLFLCRTTKLRNVSHLHSLFIYRFVVIGGLVVSVFAIGPKVRVLKSDRGRWIFKGDKLRKGSTAVGPML